MGAMGKRQLARVFWRLARMGKQFAHATGLLRPYVPSILLCGTGFQPVIPLACWDEITISSRRLICLSVWDHQTVIAYRP